MGPVKWHKQKIKNPLGYLKDSFETRPIEELKVRGGSVNPSQYFSGKEATPFFGISYLYK